LRTPGLTVLDRTAKSVDALIGDQGLQSLRLGSVSWDAASVTLFGFGPEIVGFGEEPARVEGDDLDVQTRVGGADRVRDGLVLKAEARRERHASGNAVADQAEPDRERGASQRRRQTFNGGLIQAVVRAGGLHGPRNVLFAEQRQGPHGSLPSRAKA
jgi:hypothetical protein